MVEIFLVRSKLGHGLYSGKYSKPPKTEGTDEEKAADEVFNKQNFLFKGNMILLR